MAYQLFRTWVLKGRQKLSKLEQHLVISYTKGPKDPKCIYYLTEALRPALAEEEAAEARGPRRRRRRRPAAVGH